MVRKLAKVLKVHSLQCPLEVFIDGDDDYTYVLPLCFQLGLVDYGQLIKIREHGRVVRKEKQVVMVSLLWVMWRRLLLRILMVFCMNVWVVWLGVVSVFLR
jgi:hypothetical protein